MSDKFFIKPPLLFLRLCGLFICAMVGTSAHAGTHAPGVALRPLSRTQFDTSRLVSLCQLQTPACDASATKAYVRNKVDDGFVYLIDTSKPMLIRVKRQAKNEAGRSWNFAEHVPTFQTLEYIYQPDQDPWLSKPEIYPALYQLDANRWAIALTQSKRFMYSGGGGLNEAADFLELLTNGDRPGPSEFKPVYLGVPFSSSNFTRSCFNKKDHADLIHHRRLSCHDEKSTYLKIGFADTPPLHGPWRFTWHSFYQSSVSTKENVKRRMPLDIKVDEDLKTIDRRLATYFVNSQR